MGLVLHLGTPEALLVSMNALTKLPSFQILGWRPRPRAITRSACWGAAELGRGGRGLRHVSDCQSR
eukprot:10378217-Alexandrium_andersonii.AAC.1